MAAATQLDWDTALAWIDDRTDYGELRIVALTPIGNRLFFVVFVDRDEARRILSLRKANRREVNHYVRTKEGSLRVTTLEEDQEATNASNADPDAKPLTEKQMGQMVPLKAL